ncbi:hypothetical protein MFLAVUS_009881 [Mucor flavus]|uniref:Uncharacterized protein n=1 Tax=Mucor flavus TaxID=439312 RepID=A0ABP9ZB56_9FUNG
MKYIGLCLVVMVLLCQVAMADIFSQLQFMKIASPTNGQSFSAGQKVTIKYVMQPLVLNQVSNGFAKQLTVNFHTRTGNTKQTRLENISPKCPITALEDKYKTYSKQWTVPANLKPGSYAFDFVEVVQLRRGVMTASETVNVNIVD